MKWRHLCTAYPDFITFASYGAVIFVNVVCEHFVTVFYTKKCQQITNTFITSLIRV